MTLTIEQFCDRHDACREGREWALSNCKDMEEVWQTAKPDWLLWIATREGVLTDKELRLFVVWCARQVQHLMTDERSINALDVAERHANGCETDEELTAVWAAAYAAATAARDAKAYAAASAARATARDAKAYAAATAAMDAAWEATTDAARAAARDAEAAAWYAVWATTDADRAAAWAAVWAAVRNADSAGYAAWAAAAAIKERQAAWLRENCKPKLFE